MNAVIASILSLASVLVPSKGWYTPNEPILITVKGTGETTLLLTDFAGKTFEAQGGQRASVVTGEQQIDAKRMFPILSTPGAYVLFALPQDSRSIRQFAGTPLAIGV